MAGTVKKLQFSEGTNVGAPTDLGIASSTVVISAYANDGAYTSANGAAVNGSAYVNTTSNKLQWYSNSAWRTGVFDSGTATSVTLTTCLLSGSLDVAAAGNFTIGASVGANSLTLGGATSTVVVAGNLTVNGTTTTVSTTNLDVEDKNITINDGGNDATSEGAGLTVERSGTSGSLIYASASASRWKVGDLSTEVDIATVSHIQAFTNKDYDGGTASNSSRMTLPKASTSTLNGLTRKQATIVYDTTTNKPKFDNGTALQDFGSGSGTGELNLVENPSAADDTTGWSTTGANGPTVARTTTSGDLPLEGTIDTALKFTSATAAGAEASHYASYTLSPGEALKSRKLKVELWMRPGTNFISNEWSISVYSGATRMALSTDSSGVTYLPNATGKFSTSFDADTSTSYTLRISRPVNAGSNAGVVNLAAIVVGPGIQPQGAVLGAVTSGVALTLNNFPATSINNFSYQRNGDCLHLMGQIQPSADGVSGSDVSVSLPSGLTAATTRVPAGSVEYFTTGDGRPAPLEIEGVSGDANKIKFFSTGFVAGIVGTEVGTSSGRIADFFINALIPINEWAGSGTVNVAQNDVEYAATSGTWNADSSTTVYGPAGEAMGGALTVTRLKTVTWQTPVQQTDLIEIQVSKDRTTWYSASQGIIGADVIIVPGLDSTGAIYSGAFVLASSATQTQVAFGRYLNQANDDSPVTDWPASNAYWRVVKRKAGQAVGFGLASAEGSAGLVNPYLEGSGVVYSGTYTPTKSGESNCTVTTKLTSYIRTGKTVYVSGTADVSATASTSCEFFITLPISSDLALITDLSGIAMHSQAGALYAGGQVIADTSGNKAQIAWRSNTDTASRVLYFQFTYIIK